MDISASTRIKITVENSSIGAPVTMGIPFPQGVLESPDHVRLLDKNGQENSMSNKFGNHMGTYRLPVLNGCGCFSFQMGTMNIMWNMEMIL